MHERETPIQLVLLGGGGDLSQHKLLPALFDLFLKGKLGANFSIIGIARTERTDEDYRQFVSEAILTQGQVHDRAQVTIFCSHISYQSGSFDDPDTFKTLADSLSAREVELGLRTNRLFYLAVPPRFYEQIFQALHDCGMAAQTAEDATWSRILVEKPFGKNLTTAQELDKLLSSLYHEDQLYRIDHYLAKEAVQNLLSFRFANMLLKDSWNNQSVESVRIMMHEEKDVASRASFYEGVGALRDVGQNHILQLIALIAMEEPTAFSPQAIRSARATVLNALKPIDQSTITTHVLRAQYDGYRDIVDVPEDSETETYFELVAEVDTPTWHGVPFYVSAGKALQCSKVEVTITLKDAATNLFGTADCKTVSNQITLTVSPQQTLAITVNAKAPGLGYQLESRTLSFTCDAGDAEITNSYEKVLYDCILGDQTLFTNTEEVLAAWRYITPILEAWQTVPLQSYVPGSSGPREHIFKKH